VHLSKTSFDLRQITRTVAEHKPRARGLLELMALERMNLHRAIRKRLNGGVQIDFVPRPGGDMIRSGRVTGEDEVTSFDRNVTAKAAAEPRRVDRLALVELSEPPSASRCVLGRIFDHELNVRGIPRYE
jgi:hypothetical protein